MKAARRDEVPGRPDQARDPVRQDRVIREIDFDTYDTDWDSEAYLTVAGPELQQFGERSPTQFLAAVEKDADWTLTRRTRRHKIAKTAEGARAVGQASATPPGPPPTPACNITRRSTIGTPARRPARSAPAIRARNTCSSTTPPAIWPRSTCCNSATPPQKRSTSRPILHAVRLWTLDARNLGADGAVSVAVRSRGLSYEYRTLGSRLRQHRRFVDVERASPYDSDEGRAICGAFECDPDRAAPMRPPPRSPRKARRVPRATSAERRLDVARRSAITSAPPTGPVRRLRETAQRRPDPARPPDAR